ncbi:hypothetical protein CsSME_00023250 [Camellia sinensis var. sinensis]
MPVELEGYIRPGCTILTLFISMPNFMWSKLHEDPVIYIHDFVGAPGKMLYGRGSLLVYLNNVIFCVMRDGTSVMQVKVEEQAPKLCYVYPTCFEAGKPMEFMACGINLLQPKVWLLVSFAGKCLAYDYCVPPLYGDTEGVTASFNHQLLRTIRSRRQQAVCKRRSSWADRRRVERAGVVGVGQITAEDSAWKLRRRPAY